MSVGLSKHSCFGLNKGPRIWLPPSSNDGINVTKYDVPLPAALFDVPLTIIYVPMYNHSASVHPSMPTTSRHLVHHEIVVYHLLILLHPNHNQPPIPIHFVIVVYHCIITKREVKPTDTVVFDRRNLVLATDHHESLGLDLLPLLWYLIHNLTFMTPSMKSSMQANLYLLLLHRLIHLYHL